jgi:C-terminal processing protease CtpA/Prc
VEVKDVAQGGPAAAAGIAVGDTITAIGAQDTTAMPLSDVRRALKLLPDAPVRVKFRRGGVARDATLQPRDLIPD